jgi:hypothetical protein
VGPIAQSVEQRTFNPWVDGSSPSGPTVAANDKFHRMELRQPNNHRFKSVLPDTLIGLWAINRGR